MINYWVWQIKRDSRDPAANSSSRATENMVYVEGDALLSSPQGCEEFLWLSSEEGHRVCIESNTRGTSVGTVRANRKICYNIIVWYKLARSHLWLAFVVPYYSFTFSNPKESLISWFFFLITHLCTCGFKNMSAFSWQNWLIQSFVRFRNIL